MPPINLVKYILGLALVYFLLFRIVLPTLFYQPIWLSYIVGFLVACLTVCYARYCRLFCVKPY